MSEGQTKALPRLRWWFWLVLFAPALISATAPVITLWSHPHNVLAWLSFANIVVAFPLNFVCSIWAARQIILRRDHRSGSSPWMFLWGPLIFFLNAAIAFGGCAAMEEFARSIR
jgi:hypothetical protein